MLLQLILLFSIIIFLFISFGAFDSQKLKMTNFLLGIYFFLNIYLWIMWLQQEVDVSIMGLHLFHIAQIESFLLLLFGMVGIGISLYSNYYFEEYLHHKKNLNFYYRMILPFIIAMQVIIIGNNAILFLVMWEIMTLSSYFLVIHEYKENASLEWGNYYLIIAHVGMFFILLSFIPFIIASSSFDFINWSWIAMSESYRNIAFFSALLGFWAKAGIWPLDIWLPKAHPIAPSNVSALMSGFMVKLPIMMLLKFIVVFFALKVNLSWWITLLIMWSFSAFFGIFYALTQNDIKRVLAFSTIENVGFIIANLWVFVVWTALWNTLVALLGLVAMLYHSANHSLYKTLMFLLAWSIIERTGTRSMTKMWGLVKVLPFLSIITLFWVLTISWIPPFASFNSELTGIMWILKIITDTDNSVLQFIAIGCIILIALMSIFAFISFSRLYTIIFVWRQRDKELITKTKSNTYENISYVFFLFTIFLLSIFPWIFTGLANSILQGNTSVSLIILQVGDFEFIPLYLILVYVIVWTIVYLIYQSFLWNITKIEPWNCGYAHIPHRSQYSPRSLIQPIRRLYEGLYMQVSNVEYNEYYKKNRNILKFLKKKTYFTNIWYTGFMNFIQYCWTRVRSLQNGILQYYIWYLFGTLLIMLFVLYHFL